MRALSRAMCAFSVSAFAVSAMAQTPDSKLNDSSVAATKGASTLGGAEAAVELGGALNMYDSQRETTPDVGLEDGKFGLTFGQGLARGQFELKLTSETAVEVSQANLGVDLETGTSARVGRLEPGGAESYGTANEPGFDNVDGITVAQTIPFTRDASVTLSLTGGNDLRKLGAPKTDGRALIGVLETDLFGVKTAIGYGRQDRRLQSPAAPAPEGSTPNVVANEDQFEVSLGYELEDALKVGGFYQLTRISKQQNADLSPGGRALNLVEIPESKSTRGFLWGFGVTGDSTLIGLSSMAQSGDKLIWGLGFDRLATRTAGADSDTTAVERDNDRNSVKVQGGYGVGPLGVSLAYVNAFSKAKTFANRAGDLAQRASSETVALEIAYEQ